MSAAADAVVEVRLADRSYAIQVGCGLLAASSSYARLPRGSSAMIVSNETVAALYAQPLASALLPFWRRVEIVVVRDGEEFKTWQTLQEIVDGLVDARADRGSTVFALGGGVVGDLAGFAAACYMRGIGYVQVPTTLLAQVDSSVGGKTGINHPSGKNLVGAFHQPIAIVIDVETLRTLPGRQLRAALGEAVKMAALGDERLFELLEADGEAIARGEAAVFDRGVVAELVERSAWAKVNVVTADERERQATGGRITLNLGHSLGHAVEAA